jgi:uncharacterized protein YbjT (DUF2867 family)
MSEKKDVVAVDRKSAMEAIGVARDRCAAHFVYVSVAHPAPTMHAYIDVRSRCEAAIRDAGLKSTILRPWYVLGPGHYWPYALKPFYWVAALTWAVESGVSAGVLLKQGEQS